MTDKMSKGSKTLFEFTNTEINEIKQNYVKKAGDTMTGDLTLNDDDENNNSNLTLNGGDLIVNNDGDLTVNGGELTVNNGITKVSTINNKDLGQLIVHRNNGNNIQGTLSFHISNGMGLNDGGAVITHRDSEGGSIGFYLKDNFTDPVISDDKILIMNSTQADFYKLLRVNEKDVIVETFTGQHKCYPGDSINFSKVNDLIGLIVSSNGEYMSLNTEKPQRGKDGILISESVPIINLTESDNDKKVFGVIADVEEEGERKEQTGGLISVKSNPNKDRRVIVNSIGEGAVWVSDLNGNFENGDYITSGKYGYGKKQQDDLIHNYTVAKITMNCDFNPSLITKLKIKTIDGEQMLDEEGKLIWEEEKDEDGNNVMEPEYKIRYLNDLGEEITKEEYDELDEDKRHKAAFVGCTYHCG